MFFLAGQVADNLVWTPLRRKGALLLLPAIDLQGAQPEELRDILGRYTPAAQKYAGEEYRESIEGELIADFGLTLSRQFDDSSPERSQLRLMRKSLVALSEIEQKIISYREQGLSEKAISDLLGRPVGHLIKKLIAKDFITKLYRERV